MQLSASQGPRALPQTSTKPKLSQVCVWVFRGTVLPIRCSLPLTMSRGQTDTRSAVSSCAASCTAASANTEGSRLNSAHALGIPSGPSRAIQDTQRCPCSGRIAMKPMDKTFFKLQSQLEPMTIEERRRTEFNYRQLFCLLQ